eukprot:COSAG05_NODE_1075_length_5956_cov_28.795629_4_plen_516_part_00
MAMFSCPDLIPAEEAEQASVFQTMCDTLCEPGTAGCVCTSADESVITAANSAGGDDVNIIGLGLSDGCMGCLISAGESDMAVCEPDENDAGVGVGVSAPAVAGLIVDFEITSTSTDVVQFSATSFDESIGAAEITLPTVQANPVITDLTGPIPDPVAADFAAATTGGSSTTAPSSAWNQCAAGQLDQFMVDQCDATALNHSGCPVADTPWFRWFRASEDEKNKFKAGMCCLSCMGGCEAPDEAAPIKDGLIPALLVYAVFIALTLVAFKKTFEARLNTQVVEARRAFKKALNEKADFSAELKDYKQQFVAAAKSEAMGAVTTGDLPSTEEYFKTIAVDMEDSVANSPAKLLKKVSEKLGFSDWIETITKLLDILRVMVSEILILVSLTQLPDCYGGIKTLCGENSFFSACCWPVNFYHFQVLVAICGTVFKLGISLYFMFTMARFGGKPRYFPASFSNKFYEAASCLQLKRIIPSFDAPEKSPKYVTVTDQKPSAKVRIHCVYAHAICIAPRWFI